HGHGLRQAEGQATLYTEADVLFAGRISCRGSTTGTDCAPDKSTFATTSEAADQSATCGAATDPGKITLLVRFAFGDHAGAGDRNSLAVDCDRIECQLDHARMLQVS